MRFGLTRTIILACLLLAACSGPRQPEFVSGQTKSFELVAKQYAFEPALITVNKGDQVRLFITSADVAHGISIPAFDATTILSPGKTTELDFIADKAGVYEFRCSVQCGEGHSHMTGAIEVLEEPQ